MSAIYQVDGYYAGKWLCVGNTVVADSKDAADRFEKEYYGEKR